jgi:hypothetical protein
MRAVLMGRVTGSGGKHGDELMQALEAACLRYLGFFAQAPKNDNSELRQHRTALLAVVDQDCTNTTDTSKPSIEDVPSFESTTVLNLAGAEKREEIRLPSRERRRAFSIDGSAAGE